MKNNKKYLIPLGLLCSLGLYMAPGQASNNEHEKAKNEHSEQKKTPSSHEEAEDKQATTTLRVWATAGPLAYLDNASVIVKNNKGDIIGKGKTNSRGTSQITLVKEKAKKMPLRISISGGKEKGLPFTGHLSAIATATGDDAPVVFLDLLSAAATRLVKQGYAYPDAKLAVRDALGISPTLPEDYIRTFNHHVLYTQLQTAERNAGGFDKLIDKIASAALAGRPFTELKALPTAVSSRAAKPSAKSPAAFNAQATIAGPTAQATTATATTTAATTTTTSPSNPSGSSSPLCTMAVPDATSTTSSTAILEDIGAVGIGALMDKAGVPPTSATTIVTIGMGLMQPSNQNGLTDIANELDCISSQINAISVQVSALTIQTEALAGTTCAATVGTEFNNYTNMINSAVGTNTTESGQVIPITATNSTIVNDLPNWNTTAVTNCGETINAMLFGAQGSNAGSLWLTLNQQYQDTYQWYTQTEVQSLQSFLSYWGTYSYYAFVLQNEYLNWTGPATGINETESIHSLTMAQYDINGIPEVTAGNVNICAGSSLASTPGYCIYQSNLVAAFPGDLYSDEIGLWDTGLAVNAYPGSLPISNYDNHGDTVIPPSPTGLTGESITQLYQHIFNWHDEEGHNPYTDKGPCCWEWFSNNAIQPALVQFNAQGINPGNTGSAIEDFSNPQRVRTQSLSSTQLSLLKQAQTTATGALTAQGFFNTALGGSYDYLTNDTVQSITWPETNTSAVKLGYSMILNLNTFFSGAQSYDSITESNGFVTHFPSEPPLAAFLGRNFWPAAASAIPPAGEPTNAFVYSPPNPVTTASLLPGAVTLGTLSNASLNSFSLSFTPLTLATTDLPVTYTATCDGGGTFTATSAVSPITVSGLVNDDYYNCSIFAVNAVGVGPETFFPGTNITYAAITSPLQDPTATLYRQPYPSAPMNVTGVTTALAGWITFNYYAPYFDGGSTITGYMASCTYPDGTTAVSPVVPNTTMVINVTATPAQANQAICSVVAQNNVYAGTGEYDGYTYTYGDPAALVIGLSLAPNNPHWWSTTPGMINLSYSAPSIASASPITGYTASCTATGYPTCTETVSGSSYTMSLSSCALGVAYQCSVAAENASGIGTQSALQAVTVAPAVAPDTPTNVSIFAATTTAISASFTDGYNGGSSITNHLLTCTNASTQLVAQAQGTTTPITLSGLTVGATYNCLVQAVNAVGSSLPSTVSTVTLAAIVPGAPTITSLTAAGTSITANFIEGNNGTSPITNNTLTCTDTSSGVSATASGIATPITLSGVTAGTTYSCTVTTENALGTSPSSTANTVTLTATAPDAPTITSLTTTGASITANFTEGNNGGSSITNNTLKCTITGNGVSATATGIASPITLSGVMTGATYSCAVTSINAVGTSPSSTAKSIIPATVPGVPTNVVYTPFSTQVQATFTAPSNNGGATISGYRLTCTNTSSGVSSSVTGTTSPVQFAINSLVSGMTYSCSMQSQNSVGYSASTTASSVTLAAGLPSAPTITSLTTTGASITANFTEGYDGGSPITNNTLTCKNTVSGVSATATGIASPITLSSVTTGATYSCSVASQNLYGFGKSSTASTITP